MYLYQYINNFFLFIVGTLRHYKDQLDRSLYHITHYVQEVDELYKNEDCFPPTECDDRDLQDRIVSNPIYNYQMLKRLLVYWKTMEDTIKKIDTKSKLISSSYLIVCLENFLRAFLVQLLKQQVVGTDSFTFLYIPIHNIS